MNETNGNRKACNSIIFEDDAKVITFAEINSDDVKDFPLILGEVGRNEVVAPENPEEAKELAKQAEKLRAQGIKVTTLKKAQERIAKGRQVRTGRRLSAKGTQARSEGSAR